MVRELTGKTEFQKQAAKELLADGQPHSYAEIVRYIRKQAEGTELEGQIEVNNVWQALRGIMKEPGSPYQKVKWGIYQKDPPQTMGAGTELPGGQSTIYQLIDQAVSLMEQVEDYCAAEQSRPELAGQQKAFAAIRQQTVRNLDLAVTGLSCWAAELEDLHETPVMSETDSAGPDRTEESPLSLSM